MAPRAPITPAAGGPELAFTVDPVMLALTLLVLVVAVLWWRGYGAEFMYVRFRFCTGCRRDAVNCACPVFTAWEDLSEEERDDAAL